MGFLTGKTVIITGGGRSVLANGKPGAIGYGIVTAYAKEGANIVITGRNLKKLEEAKAEIESLYGVKVLPVQADISAGADNAAIAAEVAKKAADSEAMVSAWLDTRKMYFQHLKMTSIKIRQQEIFLREYIQKWKMLQMMQ